MSRDKYSNDHTIELFGEKSLTVETSGLGGKIGLTTKGVGGDIYLQTGEAGQNSGTISLETIGLLGNIEIGASRNVAISAPLGTIGIGGDKVDISADSTIDILSDGDMRVSSALGELHLHGSVKTNMTSSGPILITTAHNASDAIALTASGPNGEIEMNGDAIKMNGHVHMNSTLNVIGDVSIDSTLSAGDIRNTSATSLVISSDTSSYALEVHNEAIGPTTNGILIDMNVDHSGAPTAAMTNNWVKFSWAQVVMGAIRGAGPIDDPPTTTYAFVVSSGPFSPEITAEGNAQFVSGNADFGEFFEAGNIEEWGPLASDATFSLQEGMVVWVVGEKFFKTTQEGAGVPMLVTKRALIVGSGGPLLKDSGDQRVGEVLSLIGKLPVLVRGATNVGDLIIPIDNDNVCRSLPKSEAGLQDYMKAVGTSLSACPEEAVLPDDHLTAPGETVNIHALLCVVGVK